MATIQPEVFTKIFFEAAQIHEAIAAAAAAVPGSPDPATISLKIDEDLSTSRVRVTSIDPPAFEADSGALEEKSEPRTFSPEAAQAVLARLIIEVQDRSDEGFQAPPIGEPADLGHRMAWDVTMYGRVSRLGLRVYQPRYLYDFRNRHGFSDATDAVFHQLWNERPGTWTELIGALASAQR